MANKEDLNTRRKCGTCNRIMVCKEVEYQGKVKYQWQNDDGKAHYKFDPDTKMSYCKIQESFPTDEQPPILAPYDLDKHIDDAKKVTRAFIQLLEDRQIDNFDGIASVWNTIMMRRDK